MSLARKSIQSYSEVVNHDLSFELIRAD